MFKMKKRSIEEVIKICEAYEEVRKESPYSAYTAHDLLEICDKMKALGLEWGDKFNIPTDFRMTKRYYLTNSATHYQPADNTYYIEWDNGNVGRLQFVSLEYYGDIEPEWNEFLSKLKSYNPVDYDPLNCHMIFNIKDGKNLMRDYKKICDEICSNIDKKLKLKRLIKMQKEVEELQKDLDKVEEI